MTLITAHDVVRYFPMRGTADPASFRDFLVMAEEKIARELLGWEFYKLLLTSKADHSAVLEYSSQTTYQVGDLCLLTNVVYEATAIALAESPPNSDFWKEAPSFVEAILEEMWSKYLRRLIAARVALPALPSVLYQIGASGIQKAGTNMSEPITRSELAHLESSIADSAANWEQLMDEWAKEQTSASLSLYVGLTTHRKNQRRRRANFGFNLNL